MNIFMLALLVPILGLLAAGLVPSAYANSRAKSFRSLVTAIAGLNLLVAAVLLAIGVGDQMFQQSTSGFGSSWVPSAYISFHFNAVASLMLLLVSFVGWIICRYSIRYLDGDQNQGRFYRWAAFTIGAVSLLVVSGNLVMFFAAWVMTSFGLHQLLLHYPERTAAKQAAWAKFAVSRIGDCFLLAAVILVYREFGTFDFQELFAAVETGSSASLTAIAWCLMLGAVTKSAQFPFHGWLPNTMETPTPVSALMHAGIVNAGGYLVIRLSPLIVTTPSALAALAIIGITTVCFAGVVMLTQNSIKRSLAYSTIAQMGFMMLQCGLGAFSAAMLHIIAHSLYKAFAFLGSGSVLTEAAKSNTAVDFMSMSVVRPIAFAASAFFTISAVAATSFLLGVDLTEKSGGLALVFILCVALVTLLQDLVALRDLKSLAFGHAMIPILACSYLVAYSVVDKLVGSGVATLPSSVYGSIALVAAMIAFAGMLVMQLMLSTVRGRQLLAPIYVHASNAFYVDALFSRLTGKFQPLHR